MTKPHTCPRCEGRKFLDVGQSTPCETCQATGVVWEPAEPSESESAAATEDHLDLTYRP